VTVSYVGYNDATFKVDAKTAYTVFARGGGQLAHEVVVVGYGTMKKSDLAGASVSLDEKTLKSAPITNVDDALQAAWPV
jgi:hypothetical protein